MFPSECVLERRVRSDGHRDLTDTKLPLFILECKDRKAYGYADGKLKIYNKRLQRMKIGVRLADAPPAVSYLAILGGHLFAQVVAVDKNVIVIRLHFSGDGGRMSYLVYDAIALSLSLIALPENPSWIYTLSSNVSIARACQDDASYALVHTGRLACVDEVDSLYLWRPSSSSQPWSEKKKSSIPYLIDWSMNETDTEFSFNGHAYWVDFLRGVSHCRCDALFDDNTSVAKFGGFIRLPLQTGFRRSSQRVSQPIAYRTMGVVRDSFIRFVSIDGFQDYVQLKDRTVTVWKLLGHDDEEWEKEHELSLETLWGFEGFGDLPKYLTPMYPHLSTNDANVVYLELGEYREDRFKWKFIVCKPRYLLAVDMRNKIVTSVPLAHRFPAPLLSCGFSRSLCQALVGPCDNKGIPIPMKKKPRMRKRRRDGGNVGEAPIPMKKKPRMEKLRRAGGNVAGLTIPMMKKLRMKKLMRC